MNLIINASEAIGDMDGVIHVVTSLVAGDSTRKMVLQSMFASRSPTPDAACWNQSRSRIFDPFFSTKFAGRGMGLAVVQGVVRDHAGAITLISEPGRGTTSRSCFRATAKRPMCDR